MKRELIDEIKALGFDVYMRDPENTYLYYTDGVSIGYAQLDFGSLKIYTVHKPCSSCGTGYALDQHFDGSKESLLRGFMFKPAWASGSAGVTKWRDMGTFLAASQWNAGFVKQ